MGYVNVWSARIKRPWDVSFSFGSFGALTVAGLGGHSTWASSSIFVSSTMQEMVSAKLMQLGVNGLVAKREPAHASTAASHKASPTSVDEAAATQAAARVQEPPATTHPNVSND